MYSPIRSRFVRMESGNHITGLQAQEARHIH